MLPMLASRGERVPEGADWVHEVKWDGMRVLLDAAPAGTVRVFSRNENDVTVSFPELRGLSSSGRDLLLDGEVVALGDGVPTFAALGERMHVRDPARALRLAETRPVTLLVFDVLRLDGDDLCERPLSERRVVLEGLGLDDVSWQVPPTYDDGQPLLDAVAHQGLEGIVSKKLSSRYRPGQRSRDWLKFPLRTSGSFVVGGFRSEREGHRLGALLVGQPTSEGLSFRGRVGSGIGGRAASVLSQLLTPLVADRSPFVEPIPRPDATGTTWVEPSVVVDVEYLLVTTENRLRQPAYRGVRTDLAPTDLE